MLHNDKELQLLKSKYKKIINEIPPGFNFDEYGFIKE